MYVIIIYYIHSRRHHTYNVWHTWACCATHYVTTLNTFILVRPFDLKIKQSGAKFLRKIGTSYACVSASYAIACIKTGTRFAPVRPVSVLAMLSPVFKIPL